MIPDGGPAMVLNPDTSSCVGSSGGKPIGMQSDIPTGNPLRADLLTLPAVGHPAFGDFGGGTSFLAPTTGLLRAVDLAANDYQGGEDSTSVWDPATGQFRAGFPQRTNDLSFLTGPSVGDIGGAPGEEVVAGTAYQDLQAFGAGGAPPSAGWPKLTGDWMVANPLLGTWDELEDSADARRVVVAATRTGLILPYATPAGACAPASWPRFHHDEHNSGDARTDAVAPGRPRDAARTPTTLTFRAPAEDRRCGGKVAGYELLDTDDSAPAPTGRSSRLGCGERRRGRRTRGDADDRVAGRHEACRGGAGGRRCGQRVAPRRRVPGQGPRPGADADPHPDANADPRPRSDPGSRGDADAVTRDRRRRIRQVAAGGSGAATPPPAAGGGTSGSGGRPACADRVAPMSRPLSARLRISRRRIVIGGRARDTGCGGRVARVTAAVGVRVKGGCRFLRSSGRLSSTRSCRRTSYVTVSGTTSWSRTFRGSFPRGHWFVWTRAVDARGNVERKARGRNLQRFRL